MLLDLPAGQEIPVSVNEDTFENPAWIPETGGVLVVTRSGRVAEVEFGVIESGELEGSVTGAHPNDLTAQLIDKSGKQVFTSVVDGEGVYAFSQIRPGSYILSLADATGHSCGGRAVDIGMGSVVDKFDVPYIVK